MRQRLRHGSNQFVAIAANCTAIELQKVAERLANVVSCSSIPWWGDQLSATVSIGGTIIHPDDTVESIVERAENSLAQGLEKGRSITLVE